MSENTPQNTNKKSGRLGRGIGSLLGGGAFDTVSDEAPKTSASSAQSGTSSEKGSSPYVQTPQTQTAVTGTSESTLGVVPYGQTIQQPTPPAGASVSGSFGQVGSQTVRPSLEPQRPAIAEEAQIWKIPIDRLRPNTQQPRQIFESGALKDLTSSIKEKGILQPITARRISEREFEIIAGERRWRAAQAAGLHEVPVILRKVSEQDSLELAIIENIQRENLNVMEEAEAFEHLMNEYSLTQQQIADKLGKERSSVANTLRLLGLPAELKLMVRANELSSGHAKVLLGVEGVENQIELARQVIEEKLSVRATEKLVAKSKTDARTSNETAPQKEGFNVDVSQRLIDGLSAELQKLIGTKVAIDYAQGKGKLAVHFYSDDQLSQIVEKLRKAWEK